MILRKRIYTGDFDWDGVTYHGKHEALVSKRRGMVFKPYWIDAPKRNSIGSSTTLRSRGSSAADIAGAVW